MSTALTSVTLALSAFLLFLVEPLVARLLLPLYGGAAAVWLSAMLFFQAALLAGYFAADQLSRRSSPRAQAMALCALFGAGLFFLPTAPPLQALAGAHPALGVVVSLAASVGAPYLALSATGPLVQSWWARTRGAPWRLYALSNAASLLGLLAYPAALEPLFDLPGQARLWAGGYLTLCGLVAGCAWQASRAAPLATPAAAPSSAPALDPRAARRWAWLVLPACTSALLLGVTAHLTQNVAPIPLLWVAPLAVYLISFVLAFEGARPPLRRIWLPLCVLGLGALARAIASAAPDHARRSIALELLSLLAVCTAAHGELCRERPAASGTTAFYLQISLGSAAGALLVVASAPLLFRTELELPLSVFATALALAALLWREPLAVPGWIPRTRVARTISIVCLGLLAVQLAVGEAQGRSAARWAGRSFYGALRVADDHSAEGMPARVLFHGSTVHGQELLPPAAAETPLGYYGVGSGAGRSLRAAQARAAVAGRAPVRVGVVGLGVGVVASYCRPGDQFVFYELDPLVIEVARQQFGFLGRCAGSEIVLGDARLTLGAQPPQGFDLLMLDAFASDAIPIHLLTREAFALYQRHLAPDGMLLVHVSNRFLDLSPVLAQHAAEAGLHAFHLEENADFAHLRFPNRYILLVRDAALVKDAAFTGTDELRALAPVAGFRPWTDQYANLAGLLN